LDRAIRVKARKPRRAAAPNWLISMKSLFAACSQSAVSKPTRPSVPFEAMSSVSNPNSVSLPLHQGGEFLEAKLRALNPERRCGSREIKSEVSISIS